MIQSPIFSMLIMTSISGAYFYYGSSSKILPRVLSSVHGLLGASFLLVAMLIWDNGLSSPEFELIYTWVFLLPLSSIIFSFLFFSGNKWLHLLQLVNLIGLAWCWFVGVMAVTGNWL